MDKFLAFIMQPTTIHGIGVLVGLAGYHLSSDPLLAGAFYAAVHVLIPQQTPVAQTAPVAITGS